MKGYLDEVGARGLLDAVSDRARSAARALRRLPDRLFHPLRRRRARRRLEQAGPAGPVLFVCHGNICRSPYAEAVFRRLARGRVEAFSGGLTGPDRPSPPTAVEVARERGVDLTGHRSRMVTTDALREAGTVVVMEAYQSRELRRRHGFSGSLVLGDLDPEPIRRRPVRDPIFQPAAVFRRVYARIDRCVAEMVMAMTGLAPRAAEAAGETAPGLGAVGAGDPGVDERQGDPRAAPGAGSAAAALRSTATGAP